VASLVRRTLVVVLVTLSIVGTAAGRPGGPDVLDDVHDNGRIDRTWTCERLLDGLTSLPQDEARALDEIERHLRSECGRFKGRTSQSMPATVVELEVSAPLTVVETFAAPTDLEGDTGFFPWDVFVVGLIAGGLIVLAGAAAHRRRRLPP